ncbi:hypothetical protein L917_02691 [Phytophthora nicotianae]|uniref:Uncharacterized protein n=1 Tax=Phytophthora nicotianae TaxID=4792 RepID=W2LTB5_PHYNI|nr:hypothetical protein L917_02691 [Phytophthora nicotianae]
MRIDTACTQAVVHAIMDDPELYQSGILDSWCSVVSPFIIDQRAGPENNS